eukprot:SAG22_NODE_667_length_8010_cov_2.289091_4_plen_54_part_00
MHCTANNGNSILSRHGAEHNVMDDIVVNVMYMHVHVCEVFTKTTWYFTNTMLQ